MVSVQIKAENPGNWFPALSKLGKCGKKKPNEYVLHQTKHLLPPALISFSLDDVILCFISLYVYILLI
jgi:hypothetical protein